MADGIQPTEQDIEIARNGVLINLQSMCPDVDEQAMTKFIDQQARVIASERAYQRMLQNILHIRDELSSGFDLLLSYDLTTDVKYADNGHTYIGVGRDKNNAEVHVFVKKRV